MTLDDLPLDVLLALQEAMTDPSRSGTERARQRAAGAGVYLQLGNAIGEDGRVLLQGSGPIALPEASEDEADAIELSMEGGAEAQGSASET